MNETLSVVYERVTVIQALIDKNDYESYLEIGCLHDVTFNAVKCVTKVGVDPNEGGTIRATSDAFFKNNSQKFDIIFIDSSHQHHQVFRDIENSLKSLTENGCIVLHDCNPASKQAEALDACGTAWRAFVQFRNRSNLNSMVCDFDHGVGVILQQPNETPFVAASINDLTYEHLDANRFELLNLKQAQAAFDWINSH